MNKMAKTCDKEKNLKQREKKKDPSHTKKQDKGDSTLLTRNNVRRQSSDISKQLKAKLSTWSSVPSLSLS
jgi:hypothetical protein